MSLPDKQNSERREKKKNHNKRLQNKGDVPRKVKARCGSVAKRLRRSGVRERCSFECDGLRTSHLSDSLEPCERGVKPAVTSHLSAYLEPCEIV